jgi:hypothetical protein
MKEPKLPQEERKVRALAKIVVTLLALPAFALAKVVLRTFLKRKFGDAFRAAVTVAQPSEIHLAPQAALEWRDRKRAFYLGWQLRGEGFAGAGEYLVRETQPEAGRARPPRRLDRRRLRGR